MLRHQHLEIFAGRLVQTLGKRGVFPSQKQLHKYFPLDSRPTFFQSSCLSLDAIWQSSSFYKAQFNLFSDVDDLDARLDVLRTFRQGFEHRELFLANIRGLMNFKKCVLAQNCTTQCTTSNHSPYNQHSHHQTADLHFWDP